jgi:hypothetical protein
MMSKSVVTSCLLAGLMTLTGLTGDLYATTPEGAHGRDAPGRLRLADVAPIPSFSRQTGLACSACHTSFPQLNAFGRNFKLNGYTLTAKETIAEQAEGEAPLRLTAIPGLSAMIQASYTTTNEAVPGTQNGDVDLPQQFSFFYGGAIAPKVGAFVQVTYAAEDGSLGFDNADVRFATHARVAARDMVLGFTLNNNPTVQDVWNTLPAWGYPFASAAVAPAPAAASLIDGTLAQQVAGLGTYAFWNNMFYGELSLYRSAPQGAANPPDESSELTTKGVAPYWRLTFERQWGPHSVMLGTYGLHARLFPTGVSGSTDEYTDIGIDGQYQRRLGPGSLTARTTWIHESQNLDASFEAGAAANPSNTLDTYRLNGTFYLDRGIGFTLGFFTISGDADTGLYQPGDVDGSRTGEPDSNGFLGQLDFGPWLNTRFALQYTLYNKFNGAGTDYDGSGRNASDNNTLYLLGWLVF